MEGQGIPWSKNVALETNKSFYLLDRTQQHCLQNQPFPQNPPPTKQLIWGNIDAIFTINHLLTKR